jgi:hypothetical protein
MALLEQLHDMKNNAANVSRHPVLSEVVDWKTVPQAARESTLGTLLAACTD